MTTQEKLQAVTEQIRKDIPRLMELSEGCEITSFSGDTLKIIHNYVSKEFVAYKYDDFELLEIQKEGFESEDGEPASYYIKGHEPMLSNILEWFEKRRQLPEDTFFQDVLFQTNNGKYLEIYGDSGLLAKWDLSKPYLKDQNDELIGFLYNLKNK